MKKERIEWIDVLKFLGIMAIFLGHLGEGIMRMHGFVFLYHVPLFFFASGLFADHNDSLSFWKVVKKKWKQLIIPYLFFTIITMIVIILTTEKDFITYLKYVKQFVFGIRNQMPAASLWFFSCLFCMSIIFDLLRRLLKKNWLVMLSVIGLYLCAATLFPNKPDVTPSWIFNLDSACYYMIFYALGYVWKAGPAKRDGADNSPLLLKTVGFVVLAGYVVMVYVQEDLVGQLLYRVMPEADLIYPVLRAMLLIIFNIMIAKILTSFQGLAYVGAQTLWLCGNEYIVKTALRSAAEMLGWKIEIMNVPAAFVYVIIMIIVIIYVFVPAEKIMYQRFCGVLEGIMNKKKDKGE